MKHPMKKFRYFLIPVIVFSLFLVSCEEDDFFEESMLVGKWQSGTEHYRFNGDGSGSSWDTQDVTGEEQAQALTWSLQQAEITIIHVIEIGGSVPKVYTILELNSTTLRWEDDFGRTQTFTKVPG